MHVASVYRPNQKAARNLVARYDERLACVRYRYDPVRSNHYKAIALIVEATPWRPDPSAPLPP